MIYDTWWYDMLPSCVFLPLYIHVIRGPTLATHVWDKTNSNIMLIADVEGTLGVAQLHLKCVYL